MIGGVKVHVGPQGNVSQVTRGRHGQQRRIVGQQRRSPPSPVSDSTLEPGEMDSDAILDYLQNVGAASDSGGEEGGSEGDGSALHNLEVLRRFSGVELGDEGAPEDIIGRFEQGWEDSSDESEEESGEEDEDASSMSSFSSDEDDMIDEEENLQMGNEDGGAAAIGVLTLEELEQLDPSMRYPVAVRPAVPPQLSSTPGAGGSGGRKKGGRGKGGKGGKLAPGEKARLRRERIEAKRAQRAVGRGFDLAWINKELQDFVESESDMYAFPPMPKHECRQVQRLAALYGCKAGAQGSGKKRSVMVVSTARTALPKGQALLEVGRVLMAHTHGSEFGAAAAALPTGRNFLEKEAKGRWADVKKKKKCTNKRSSGGGQRRGGKAVTGDFREYDDTAGPFMPTGHKPHRKYSQPVSFVSHGTINPEDVPEVEVYDRFSQEIYAVSDDMEMEMEGRAGLGSGGAFLAGLQVFEDRRGGSIELSPPRAGLGSGVLAALPVFEDRRGGTTEEESGGLESDKEMESGGVSIMSGVSLSRGAVAAEGITNSGRLLGLGMALGIGAEVFGAPGLSIVGARDGEEIADLSPLQPKLSKSAQRKLSKRRSQQRPDSADMGPRKPAAVSGDYADFEQHTTGIGSKLLAKWGFAGAGAGLGRDGTGISEPLQAKMRVKKLGLGAER